MAGQDDGHALPRGIARLLLANEEVQVLRQARHERRARSDAVAVERLALWRRLAAPLRRCARLGGVARAAEAAAPLLVHLRGRRGGRQRGEPAAAQSKMARALARGATPSMAMYSIFSGCIICVANVVRAEGGRAAEKARKARHARRATLRLSRGAPAQGGRGSERP